MRHELGGFVPAGDVHRHETLLAAAVPGDRGLEDEGVAEFGGGQVDVGDISNVHRPRVGDAEFPRHGQRPVLVTGDLEGPIRGQGKEAAEDGQLLAVGAQHADGDIPGRHDDAR